MADSYWVVIGRNHGDDEDSLLQFQCETQDEAEEAFRTEMREFDPLPEGITEEQAGDPDTFEEDGYQIYINHVIRCDSKPDVWSNR